MNAPQYISPACAEWNRNSEYKWVYFAEEIKEALSFWLASRVKGETNVELGGGWYESVPGSVVVDYSSIAIEANSAKEKHVFDLNSIKTGEYLPFENERFESATMISVWQYLEDSKGVLQECSRILQPGGRLYIINDTGSGISEFMKNPSDGRTIAAQIDKLGYKTEVERIDIGEGYNFQCVIVTMPDNRQWELSQPMSAKEFAHNTRIQSQRIVEQKQEEDAAKEMELQSNGYFYQEEWRWNKLQTAERVSQFQDSHIAEEITRAKYFFSFFTRYNPTKFSREYLENICMEAQKLEVEKGVPCLLWTPLFQLEFDLLTKASDFSSRIHIMPYDIEKTERFGGSVMRSNWKDTLVYTEDSGLQRILTQIEKGAYSVSESIRAWNFYGSSFWYQKHCDNILIPFLSHTPLNDFTREMQQKVRNYLIEGLREYHTISPSRNDSVKDFEHKIAHAHALQVYNLFAARKQVRRINDLLETHQKILSQEVWVTDETCQFDVNWDASNGVMREVFSQKIREGFRPEEPCDY